MVSYASFYGKYVEQSRKTDADGFKSTYGASVPRSFKKKFFVRRSEVNENSLESVKGIKGNKATLDPPQLRA